MVWIAMSDMPAILPDDPAALKAMIAHLQAENARIGAENVRVQADIEKMSAQLVVTFDENGTARISEIGPADQGRMSDPRFRAFAERAARAVLDPRCASLPIPRTELGKRGKLTFRFKP